MGIRMKKSLAILILIYLANPVFAQENSNWINSILNQIVLNQIEVFDDDFKSIENSDLQIIQIDTVVNCQWTRPKYINNVFQSSFDGLLIESQITFDTSTNKIDSDFIDFKVSQFDKNGNYLGDEVVFLIERKQKTRNQRTVSLDILKNTAWINKKIYSNGKEIELDSCHHIFKLQLNGDFTFHQYYGDNQTSCRTQFMEEEKQVGVEGNVEDFIKYHDKLQGHYLTVQSGIWQTENNELRLIDRQTKKIIVFEIKNINQDELHLKSKENNYEIKMIRADF